MTDQERSELKSRITSALEPFVRKTGQCSCDCHSFPGIMHFAPCCSPVADPSELRLAVRAVMDQII